jgi:hypothetical protein
MGRISIIFKKEPSKVLRVQKISKFPKSSRMEPSKLLRVLMVPKINLINNVFEDK